MPLSRSTVLASALLGATCATVAFAHPDDPKVRDRMPAFAGAGWTEASDAPGPGFAASNVAFRSWITVNEFGTGASGGNDCWGWTSPAGREYALMGLSNATAFVDITNPGSPVIRDTVLGPESLWRDVKTFGSYAYVVTEGFGAGVQVIDMSDLDTSGEVTLVTTISGPGSSDTHNVAIDTTSGFLYRCGGDYDGLRIYSLANPANPVFVGDWTTKYVHDLQVVTYTEGPFAGRQIAYLCSGFNNGFVDTGLTVLDVTNKNAPVVLDTFLYPGGEYSHQAWLNEDRTKLYLNDELDEGNLGIDSTIHVFDVSDPENVSYDGAFNNGVSAIGHNLYIKDDLLYSANYRSGMRVFDLSVDAVNPPEVAFFDTFPSDDAAFFNGAWSIYPFFESGSVIISDLERGLFVVELDQPEFAITYPDGRPELVDPAGQTLRTQVAELVDGSLAGADVRLNVVSSAGLDVVAMTPIGGGQFEAAFPAVDCPDTISWWIEAETADGDVTSDPLGAPTASYSALAADGTEARFADDAESNPGWTVTNVAIDDGAWSRGVPAGDGDRGDPTVDFDGSGAAWLTDNVAGNSDVDGGPTVLTSPRIDLSGTSAAVLRYARWFTNDDGDEDRLRTEISDDDGATWVFVEETGTLGDWEERSIRVDDFIELSATVRVRFSATDNPNNSVTEAGIDAIRIDGIACDATVPEDVNGDGSVGFDDLVILLSNFGPCGGPDCPADVDEDGDVDFSDLVALLAAWG